MNRHLFTFVLLVLVVPAAYCQTVNVIDSLWTDRGTQVLDLDQDGDLDILSDPFYGPEATMWLNDGWQNFSRVQFATGNVSGTYLAAGDMDGDHDIDLVLASYDNDLIWIENRPGNSVAHAIPSRPPAGLGYRGMTVSDFDLDGDLDVITTTVEYQQNGRKSILLHRNDGNHVFTLQVLYESTLSDYLTEPHCVDVDQDGFMDVGVPTPTDHLIFHNDGNDSLSPVSIFNDYGWCDHQCWEDWDLDGDLDCFGSGSNAYVYLENTSTPGIIDFREWPTILDPPQFGHEGSVQAADYNLDGIPDAAIYYRNDGLPGMNQLIHGIFDGAHTFAMNVQFTSGRGLSAADLDRDGDIDDITTDDDQGLVWLENETFSPADIRVRLIPQQTPVIVPATGGSLHLLVSLRNTTPQAQTLRAWLVYTLTDGSEIEAGSRVLTLDPNQTQHYPIHPAIPAGYDPGQYRATVRIGTYPVTIDEYSFPFWIE